MSAHDDTGAHFLSLIPDALFYALHLTNQLFSFLWQKTVIVIFLAPLLAIDNTKNNAVLALMILMIADFCSGLFAAHKTHQPIVSRKVYRTAVKIVVYFTLIATAHLTETAGFVLVDIDSAVIAFLALTELISLFENIGRAGYIVPVNVLRVLKKFRSDGSIRDAQPPSV